MRKQIDPRSEMAMRSLNGGVVIAPGVLTHGTSKRTSIGGSAKKKSFLHGKSFRRKKSCNGGENGDAIGATYLARRKSSYLARGSRRKSSALRGPTIYKQRTSAELDNRELRQTRGFAAMIQYKISTMVQKDR
jgi:hypothetical protein